jgi:hypothetical protein
MKVIIVPAALAAALALSAVQPAAAATSSATITKLDPTGHTVTLSDSAIYTFTPSVDLSMLTVGEKVTVMYSTDDATGANNATSIYPTT